MYRRHYNCKDSELIITSSTIIESAIENKEFLIPRKSIWSDPYFENFKIRIDDATQRLLGVDSALNLRQSTAVVYEMQSAAKKDLSMFKLEIKEAFKSSKTRLNEILKILGFTDFGKSLKSGDQEGMISLLYQFKLNMLKALNTEIVNKGIDQPAIDRIIGYANTLNNASVNQEHYKSNRPSLTAEVTAEFNGIYDDVISIAKISRKAFEGSVEKQNQFSFTRLVKALNSAKKPAIKQNPPYNN